MNDPKTIVYGSSYDRGLEHLLDMWPDVLKEVPDAKLRIFYGWDLFDKGYANNPERMAWREKMNEKMRQQGIIHLGRISHEACKVEMENAGIWAYPTHFGEISCITAMRAQAYGATPVVVNYGALAETVQNGCKVDGDIYEPEVKQEFQEKLIWLLKNPMTDEQREGMMKWAKEKFAWSKVAKQWDCEFKAYGDIEAQLEELMDNNQALEAWELVKDTDYPKKDRVYLKVKHAFEPDSYNKYYSEELAEEPKPDQLAFDCTNLYPRFNWIMDKLSVQKPKTLIDLGCADGYLSLTVAKKLGTECTGYNLYKPSVKIANGRAENNNLPAKFICDDLFNAKGKYDAVVLMEVLEHLPDPEKAIKHCMSLVNDGGVFYLSTPSTKHVGIAEHKANASREGWDDGKPSGHLRMFTYDQIHALLKGYSIEELQLDSDGCWNVEVRK